MKHIFYIPILLMFAMITSCDKISQAEEGGETSGSYIFFEPEVLEAVDVKSLVTGDQLPADAETAFGVIGYYSEPQDDNKTILTSIFANSIEEVYRKEAKGAFVYDNLALWKQNINHIFYGFYPYDIESNVKLNNGDPHIEYTQPKSIDGMVDILTAKRELTQTAATNNSVDLTFTHSLWALDFGIKNSQTATGSFLPDNTSTPNLYVTKVEITLCGFYKSGEILLANNTTQNGNAAAEADAITYTLFAKNEDTDKITIASGKTHSFDSILFLPTAKENLKYKICVELENSWGIAYTYSTDGYLTPSIQENSTETNFEAGKRYTLTMDKIDPTGDFTIEWGDKPSSWSEKNINHTFN